MILNICPWFEIDVNTVQYNIEHSKKCSIVQHKTFEHKPFNETLTWDRISTLIAPEGEHLKHQNT